jgi:hypothetical protein
MGLSNFDKWKFTLITAVILVVVFNGYTFKIVNSILGPIVGPIADKHNCPTFTGFAVHTLVFILALRGAMELR